MKSSLLYTSRLIILSSFLNRSLTLKKGFAGKITMDVFSFDGQGEHIRKTCVMHIKLLTKTTSEAERRTR